MNTIKKTILSLMFYVGLTIHAQAAIVSQVCVDNYININEYDGYTCDTTTDYAMEGTITLRDITNGAPLQDLLITASMSQSITYTESFSGGSSSGETTTNLTIAPIGLGIYTMSKVDWLLDGAVTEGLFSESLTGNGYTLDGLTKWLINADGITATVSTLDGDGDGISGLNLFLNGNLSEIADINLTVSTVPVPAAAWLFGSGLIGLIGFARRKKA